MRHVLEGTEPTTRTLSPLADEATLAAIPVKMRRPGMTAQLTGLHGMYVWKNLSIAPAKAGQVIVPNDVAASAAYIADPTTAPGRWENEFSTTTNLPRIQVRLASSSALAATRVGDVLTMNADGAAAAMDGKAVALNDRVLLTAQATGANCGIWAYVDLGGSSAPAVLRRVADMNETAELRAGIEVFVAEGDTFGGQTFVLTNTGTITLNSTALTFVQKSATYVITKSVTLAELQAAGAVKVYNFNITAAALPSNARFAGSEISATLVDDATHSTAVLDVGWSGTAGALASSVDIAAASASGFPKAMAGASAYQGGTVIGGKTLLGKVTTGVNLSTLTAGALTVRVEYRVGG